MMIKYYSQIGGQHHRFDAVNRYAAQQVAQNIARTIGAPAWTEPERYEPNKHGEHFWRWSDAV